MDGTGEGGVAAPFPEADPDADLYGARVTVAFDLLGDGEAAEAIPYFRVVRGSAQIATGHGQHRSGDVGRLVGGQETDCCGLLIEGSVPVQQ